MNDCLVFRVDGNTSIGTGHVMRCLALAQAWQSEGGRSVFAMALSAPALEARLTSEGIDVFRLSAPSGSVEDARETTALVQKLRAKWVVIDGYSFGPSFQCVLKDSDKSLLLVDDNGQPNQCFADIILNQNIYADESLYPKRGASSTLLLGTKYALLRREFLKPRVLHKQITKHQRILITLGGSDPENVTSRIITELKDRDFENLEISVVVGPANPKYDVLVEEAKGLDCKCDLLKSATNMAELMDWADIAISGAGSTCWELAFIGLPMILIVLADNQIRTSNGLAEAGAAVNSGLNLILNRLRFRKL